MHVCEYPDVSPPALDRDMRFVNMDQPAGHDSLQDLSLSLGVVACQFLFEGGDATRVKVQTEQPAKSLDDFWHRDSKLDDLVKEICEEVPAVSAAASPLWELAKLSIARRAPIGLALIADNSTS